MTHDTIRPRHGGLFFTAQQREQAQKQRRRAPFDAAWAALESLNDAASPLPDALRWYFTGGDEAAERAVSLLDAALRPTPPAETLPALRVNLRHTLQITQAIELLRDHPAAGRWAVWEEALSARAATHDSEATALAALEAAGEATSDPTTPTAATGSVTDHLPPVERLWLALVKMAVGIVLERSAWVADATAVYRAFISGEVHPEGYITEAVEASAAEGLRNQVLCVQALVLLAEAGTQAGADLWAYEHRGVSVRTAATYPLYFYFYPEKWPWGDKTWKRGEGLQQEVLSVEAAQAIFRDHAGWLEMLNAHYGPRPLKAVRLILDELRPVYDGCGGGLTTLSHGVAERRRGLFG